jgi:WD40 repeat protein
MRALAFSPDGSLLAAGGRNGRIRVWRAADQSVAYEAPAHSLRIREIVFSPDGSLLLSAGEDRMIRATDARTGQEVFVLPTKGCKVYCLAPLADGLLACGGSDNCITLWDLKRREAVARLAGHTGTVAGLAADETTLVSVSYDTTVRLWQVHETPALAGRPKEKRVSMEPQKGAR